MAIAGSLVVTVQAKTDQFESGMRRTRTELRTTQQAVTGMQSAFGGLTTSLVGLTAGVASVSALTAGIKDLVRVGTEMQNLRAGFAAITGSTAAGNREFQFVVKSANALGLEVKSLAEQYRSLSAATRGTALEGAATRQLFTALTQAAQAFGLSTEQTGRALTAMQQIASKGKVSMEELRGQLGEAIPGAVQIAARAFNTTTKNLEDMVAKGIDATEFWQRFTAQLKTETPIAAERAGRGIAQLGNEILLLKDRIAQSGLLKFLDDTSAKLAKVIESSRMAAENTQAAIDTLLGTYKKFATETEKQTIEEARGRPDFERILTRMAPRLKERAAETERAAARQKEINDQQIANQAILRDQAGNNKQLTEALTAQKKAVDDLNKASAATPEIYGKINGTLKEQIAFLEKRKAITEKSLETLTTTITARTERSGAAPADLLAQKAALQQQYAADVEGIAKRQKAIQDAAAAERKAIQDTAAAKRKAEQEAEDLARTTLQNFRAMEEEAERNIETLRRLSDRYTSVRADRDADTASMLKAALATSPYATEAARLAAAIEDVQRIEAQLPQLRSEAKTSAANLERFQGAMEGMQPNLRLTRQEELQRRYEDFAKTTSDQEQLRRVRTEMETTLHTERMQQLYDHLNDMAEELTNTFVDMAVTGEFSFKKFANSFSRMVLDMVADAIDLKGAISGWLKQALGQPGAGGQPGTGLLGSLGGLFGSPGGGAPALTPAPALGPAPSLDLLTSGFGGGMAGGGPVMPGKFYTVGERGPETLVAGGPGTLIPNGGGNFTMNVYTNDANSFRMNERQIAAQSARMLSRARRNL